MEQSFPIFEINRFWHVGTMKQAYKQMNSHEGAGLSVSVCPQAWEIIAGSSGDYYELTREYGQFLDFHEMNEKHIQEMIQWGIKEGYVRLETLYEYRFINGDSEEEMIGMMFTYEEALEEVGDDEEAVSIKENQPVSTEKLQQRVMGHAEPVMVPSLLSTVFAEDVLKVDGVWFHDVLDTEILSAPRGVIVPSRISEWNARVMEDGEEFPEELLVEE